MAELSLKRRRSGAISGSERITGVKNAQADVLLSKKKQHFDFLFKKKEQDIQLEEHRLENETKLLNLESKRNELDYKRRLYPDADLSNDEMTVSSLEKYLVRNAGKLCYIDKSLENKVRNKCSTDTVPPIVAEARTTIHKKELIRMVEKNRKQMYNFLDKPVSREAKRIIHEEKIDEMDEFEAVVRENKLPSFNGHLMPDPQTSNREAEKPRSQSVQHLSLPVVNEPHPVKKSNTAVKKTNHNSVSKQTTTNSVSKQTTINAASKQKTPNTVQIKVPTKMLEKMELHKKLHQNPVVREAVEAHQKDRAENDHSKPRQNLTSVLSMMSRKKPPTKTQVQEELEIVQSQVGEFCERIEVLLWEFKEEQFRQGIKFVKDKDAAWNRFMDTMKKRNRANNEKFEEHDHYMPVAPKTRRPTHSAVTALTTLTEKQKEHILMENLTINKPRLVESAPTRKRGIPSHTEERSHHHSPRAKLQRMLEKNKNILDSVVQAAEEKQDTGTAGLAVLTKHAQTAAK